MKMVVDAFESILAMNDRKISQRTCKKITALAIDSLIPANFQGRSVMYVNRVSDFEPINCELHPSNSESIVDVSVFEGERDKDPYVPIWTAESEAYNGHYVAADANANNSDYLWDLYKLLQVPSPRRLFVMRCKESNVDDAWRHIERLVKAYKVNLAENDQVFAVVVPSTRRKIHELRCRGWTKAGGRLLDMSETQKAL